MQLKQASHQSICAGAKDDQMGRGRKKPGNCCQAAKKRKHSTQNGDIFISGYKTFSQLTPLAMLIKRVIIVLAKESK